MNNQGETVLTAFINITSVTAQAAKSLSKTLAIKTNGDLADSRYFTFTAKISYTVANARHSLQRFGVPTGRVVKTFEGKPNQELIDVPLRAVESIGKQRDRELAKVLGIKTVRELALRPQFVHARAGGNPSEYYKHAKSGQAYDEYRGGYKGG